MIWALMERRTRSGKVTTMAGLFPQSTDSRRQGHHMDERVPGAAVMPGFNEEFIRRHGEYHFDEKMIADTGRIARSTNESNQDSTYAITARVVCRLRRRA
jgi:hypothetical protein